MLEITNRLPNIRIDLEPGLYQFIVEAATGKTRLANILHLYYSYGEAVNSYSYMDFKRGISLQHILSNANTKVIVIDRYDMLPPELSRYIDAAIDADEDKIIILDCKQVYYGERSSRFCSISMEESLITLHM